MSFSFILCKDTVWKIKSKQAALTFPALYDSPMIWYKDLNRITNLEKKEKKSDHFTQHLETMLTTTDSYFFNTTRTYSLYNTTQQRMTLTNNNVSVKYDGENCVGDEWNKSVFFLYLTLTCLKVYNGSRREL